MATISKVRRLVNPGKRKRRMSALQKMFFGSKRQRAAVKRKRNSGSTSRARKQYYSKGGTAKLHYKTVRSARRRAVRKYKSNVGSIVTVWPLGHRNPGRKRRKRNSGAKNRLVIVNGGARMAKGSSGRVISGYGSTVMNRGRRKVARTRRRKRSNVGRRRVYHRRRRGAARVGYTKHSRRRNPGRVRHYRRHRAVRHNRGRRRNPGMLTGFAGRVIGVIGGVAVTKFLMGFMPATFTTGILSYVATAAVAVAQGKLIGKVSKSQSTGDDFMVGGLAYLVAKALNDFFPSFGSYTGISGMGLIGGSSFYTPQVNQNGSMGTFVVPSAVMGAIQGYAPAPSNAGVGRLRRTGRLM